MFDRQDEAIPLVSERWPGQARTLWCPVPDGVVPPSFQINLALADVTADYVLYLTDDSLPYPSKIERMAGALDEHPEWGSVYCSQTYGTAATPDAWAALALEPLPGTRHASGEMPDPFCRVDHTQVMHRRSDDRWPEGMEDIRFSDGRFFQALVNRFGPMQPVPEVLDWTCQMPDGISSR